MTLSQLLTTSSGVELPIRGGSCAMTSVSRFVLSRRGTVFHRARCDQAGNAQPWAWAEPLTNSQIRRWIEPLGIRPCRRCDPLEGKMVVDEIRESSLINEGGALDRIRDLPRSA